MQVQVQLVPSVFSGFRYEVQVDGRITLLTAGMSDSAMGDTEDHLLRRGLDLDIVETMIMEAQMACPAFHAEA